tara:strand:- start:2 stop:415 length:414 start_codon:yes stop_codon:yes gene_type:complete
MKKTITYKTIIFIILVSTSNLGISGIVCNKVDCYQVPDDIFHKKIDDCLYQSQMNMLALKWKQDNNWKQVEWVGGKKIQRCMPIIPNNFKNGLETEEQLQFLEDLRCRLHNIKRDPVLYQSHYFQLCMKTFKPEQYR